MINNHETQEWRIQSVMAINFISSEDSKETRTMPTKSDNIETMVGDETDQTIKDLLNSLLERHQKGLEKSMKGSEFIFDGVDLLYYKLHRISLNRGGSYIQLIQKIMMANAFNMR